MRKKLLLGSVASAMALSFAPTQASATSCVDDFGGAVCYVILLVINGGPCHPKLNPC